jgi:hypothetical protein
MNLAELRAGYRRDARDNASPPFVADADVDYFFNEAEEEASIRKRLIAYAGTAEVAAGDGAVPLGPHVFEIHSAQIESADGTRYPITQVDELGMNRLRPEWRTETRRPEHFIRNEDGSILLGAIPDANYTMHIEGYRTPRGMVADEDKPNIASIHHRHLIQWVLFRAFSLPDGDLFDPNKAAQSEARFERYFGRKPDADLRKAQTANAPHHNKAWW